MSVQMLAVAVGYQIYELTGSAFLLGVSGLVQFIPRVLFMIPAGSAADRFDRRRLSALTQCLVFLSAAVLALVTAMHTVNAGIIIGVVFIYGTAYAFQAPSLVSLLPNMVSKKDFPQATARVSSMQQVAIVIGPAVAGFIYIAGPETVYIVNAIFNVLAIILVLSLRTQHIKRQKNLARPESPLAGLKYIWKHQGLFGAMSLDMFAVLFSGVTALLPIFAEDILHSGPVGFGFLRAAPAIGALCMAGYLSWRPIRHRVGKTMFACVALYGIGTLCFAFSQILLLSIGILVLLGVVDEVSVVIRQTYTQIVTSDDVRGRVTAVSFVFIGASNQLGEFESGVVAALIGPIGAVALGGVCTLGVVGIWYAKFKELRELDSLF